MSDAIGHYRAADSCRFPHNLPMRSLTRTSPVTCDYEEWEGWGRIVVAIAKTMEDATPVRFVHVGGASREEEVAIPGAALRSSAIQLMGSGVRSVPLPKLLGSIKSVFEAVGPARLQIATQTMDLSEIDKAWQAPGKPRIVMTIR
jgi:hypothetical protein